MKKGSRYLIQLEAGTVWTDGGRPTDPRGLAAKDIGLAGYVGVPLRRVVGANYLQPVAHIQGGSAGPVLQPLQLQQHGTPPGSWRGEFMAARSERLSLFANKGMLPFRLRLPRNVLGVAVGNGIPPRDAFLRGRGFRKWRRRVGDYQASGPAAKGVTCHRRRTSASE